MEFQNEAQMTIHLSRILENDFLIREDKWGRSITDNKRVRIDLLLYPNNHLIEKGFDPGWIGIEVKHFTDKDGGGKAAETFWQAISYQQSTYDIDSQQVRPFKVFIFTNFHDVNTDREDRKKAYHGMLLLSNYGHVGDIQLKKSGWVMRTSGSVYFLKKEGDYKRGPTNPFTNNTGNCS